MDLHKNELSTHDAEWFRVTLASIGDAVITTDMNGNVTYLNSVAEKLTGWTNVEARGKNLETIFKIINEYTRRPATNPVTRVLREGIVVGLANHTLLISKDGTEYPIEDSAAPIRDKDAKVLGVVLVFHDIVERKRAELALIESERRFRLMVEAVKDYAIFMLDPLGNVSSWNLGAERIKGYKANEIIGSHFSKFYPAEDVAAGKPEREIKLAIQDGRYEEEGWRVRKDGTRFLAHVILTAIRDESRRLLGFAKVTRDITEKKKQEEAIRHSEERFRVIVESVKDYAIFMLDTQGRISSWNLGAERINGYNAGEIIGKHFSVFYEPGPGLAAKLEEELRIAREEGRWEEEGIRLRKDGTRFWANVVITSLWNPQKELIGYAKVTRDITDRKRAEQALKQSNEELEERVRQRTAELERANRLKDEFLATLSHELRTPLMPMLGWTKMLQSGYLNEKDRARGIEIIEKNVRLQARIIEDLLDVSRIVSGKLKLELKPVGLAQVVEAALEVVRPSAEVKSIELDFLMRGSVGPVMGDAARLQQILWNLLSNAVRYTPNGGRITVELYKGDNFAVMKVIDNGEGIELEYLPFVFDRFSQADSSSKRRHGGLGIGLSIVKHIVEMHGGSVKAESGGKGKGAVFTVTVPLARSVLNIPHEYPLGQLPPGDGELKGIRILLVDDEADSREFLSLILKQFGAEVLSADSVAAALAEIDRFNPSVIVSDIGMPEQDGYDLIRQVRQREKKIGRVTPAVALTAFARTQDRVRALSEGFQDHLAKPIEPEVLVSVISRLSRKH